MIRRETPETFLATAPVDPAFHAFALQEHPLLVPLDDSPDNLVILSNGVDVAGVYRRSAGRLGIWQHFVDYLPSRPRPEAAKVAATMAEWMFEHLGAFGIWAFTSSGNAKARAFVEASGGRLISEAGDRDLFEITRHVH